MNAEHHKARELLLLAQVEGVTADQEAWTEAHTSRCAACAAFAQSMLTTAVALRSIPAAADAALVAATRSRVHRRALELAEHRSHTRMLLLACGVAIGWTIVSAPFLWQGMAWLGGWTGGPDLLWQLGFFSLLSFPTLLGAAAFLAAKNGHGAAEAA